MAEDNAEHDELRGTPLDIVAGWPLPGVVVVAVAGEIDTAAAPALQNALLDGAREHPDHLVVDLRAVTFFGAAGVTVLVGARRWAADGAFALHLTGVTDNRLVRKVLELSDLTALFTIHSDIAAAVDDIDSRTLSRSADTGSRGRAGG